MAPASTWRMCDRPESNEAGEHVEEDHQVLHGLLLRCEVNMSSKIPLRDTFALAMAAHGLRQPCCSFGGRALRLARGLEDVPAYGEVGQIDGDESWWFRINIWDHDDPWSSVGATQEVWPSALVEPNELRRKRFHAVQCWTLVGGVVDVQKGSKGHYFFVEKRKDGREIVYEMDEGYGFRRREMTLVARLHEHSEIFGGVVRSKVLVLKR